MASVPGVFRRLIENCSTETGGLISTNGRSHLVLCGLCCCSVFLGGIFFPVNDYRNLDFY